jgi:SAM-dependent methyltransferase
MSNRQPHRQALRDLLAADHPPRPWQGPGQLPWHEPEFSERMLPVHLDPQTHMASRAPEVIDRHLDWMLAQLQQRDLPGPYRILDVGCGPGLYCHELVRRGHQAVGFDFGPASLAWAIETAREQNLAAEFFAADLTDLPPDLARRTGPVDAVTFWFGEFHSFTPVVAAAFVTQLAACLKPNGLFILEYQPWDLFVRQGSNEWSVSEKSVFCDRPHLWLQEFAWDEASRTEIHVHWIIEQESGTLKRYEQCHQAWPDAELVDLLAGARLGDPTFHPPITGVAEEFEFPLLVTRRTP